MRREQVGRVEFGLVSIAVVQCAYLHCSAGFWAGRVQLEQRFQYQSVSVVLRVEKDQDPGSRMRLDGTQAEDQQAAGAAKIVGLGHPLLACHFGIWEPLVKAEAQLQVGVPVERIAAAIVAQGVAKRHPVPLRPRSRRPGCDCLRPMRVARR